MAKRKPTKTSPDTPGSESAPETPPDPKIPVAVDLSAPPAATEPHTEAATDKHKPRHSDSFDEVFVGPGEAPFQQDVPLPDVYEMLGLKDGAKQEEQQEGQYRTEMVQGAGDINLIWHPTIVAGRCELCGSTRYVGGEVWKQIERKTGEVKYKYRGGKWVEISAKTCPHYRHVKVACSYCREEFTGAKDRLDMFNEILGNRNIFVVSEPGRPNSLIMVCSDFTCKNKFNEQFHINNH